MEVVLLILCCFLQFQSATPLQCYHCKTKNELECLEVQTTTTCKSNQHGSCMSLSYDIQKGRSDASRFIKGCWESYPDCNNYCSHPDVVDDVKNCKVNCCKGDACNKHGLKKEVIKDNRKRSANQNNAAYKTEQLSTFFIVSIISSVHYIVRRCLQI